MNNGFELEPSEYLTIKFTVPATHAHLLREALGKAGAGEIGNYSYCSFSISGIGRFRPNEKAHPHIGKPDELEEVMEEQIETICHRSLIEKVLEEIKKAHPYEEFIIDLYPIYKKAIKTVFIKK